MIFQVRILPLSRWQGEDFFDLCPITDCNEMTGFNHKVLANRKEKAEPLYKVLICNVFNNQNVILFGAFPAICITFAPWFK